MHRERHRPAKTALGTRIWGSCHAKRLKHRPSPLPLPGPAVRGHGVPGIWPVRAVSACRGPRECLPASGTAWASPPWERWCSQLCSPPVAPGVVKSQEDGVPVCLGVGGGGRNSLKPKAGQVTPVALESPEDNHTTSPSSEKPAIAGQEPRGTIPGDRQHTAATAPRCRDSTRSQQWR